LIRKLTGTVIRRTKMTATPSPNAVFTDFETARNEHMPRKKAKIILSTNIDFMNIFRRFSIAFSF
jgi:hypothetical protein